ncbi:MAG: hypothetical protein AB7K09_20350 [Planctomycetota bacterium]
MCRRDLSFRVLICSALLVPLCLGATTGCWSTASTTYTVYDNYKPTDGRVTVAYTDNWVFYPGADVYYCSGRHAWYYNDNGRWIYTIDLPRAWAARLGNYVVISYTGETPYVNYDYHCTTYYPTYQRLYHKDHAYYHMGGTRSYREARAFNSTGANSSSGYYTSARVARYSESRR